MFESGFLAHALAMNDPLVTLLMFWMVLRRCCCFCCYEPLVNLVCDMFEFELDMQ
ncbi:hypothetical protein HanRHA438_Chr06g0254191 [Helianthus annuus]|uniref:Uncharacterized protein n=1 Tax=Helianthus annuus TaxID=4232 RepID=A0A9K3IQP9_HELAN|nr:hypothetical protein HanXRQr2_Chr06g0245101 [Helianthus annuus]KAJ0559511.1 hypothetical protein HanHA300_Chr06g0201121 [Helianthus annuus]KAJ0565511.1 hypothetical protein HanIR_Chr06g0263381 [Helianthus annuus]KAJ0572482.1 hypothetical protein HanHA89_Chr06g0216161 [Helianthus annuus]KAJ0736921.1 hypothetical protein HanLR1_Chr06g0201171 [Helianthus annuus]